MVSVIQTKDWSELDNFIIQEIRRLSAARRRPLSILEAGCGRKWGLDLEDVDFRLTGVDVDAVALKLRLEVQRDLDEAIHGDLLKVDLPDRAFDVVYSSYVLEHVERADLLLDRFARWLSPGGLLVLRLPAPESFRGTVARLTPHWIHVAYYRWAQGSVNAGKPGYAPYRTYYHPAIRKSNLLDFFHRNSMECIGVYGDRFRNEPFLRLGGRLVRICTRGQITDEYSDLLYLARVRD